MEIEINEKRRINEEIRKILDERAYNDPNSFLTGASITDQKIKKLVYASEKSLKVMKMLLELYDELDKRITRIENKIGL